MSRARGEGSFGVERCVLRRPIFVEPKDNNLIKSAIDRLEEPDVSEDEKF